MFSETSVHFQRTTRRYIPEDSTGNNHCCEILKSYILLFLTIGIRYVKFGNPGIRVPTSFAFLAYFPYFEKIK
jgi:hypothetical protein